MPAHCMFVSCGAPCRGTCSKCGARVCVQHKQASSSGPCACCRKKSTSKGKVVAPLPYSSIAPYPTLAQTPTVQAPFIKHHGGTTPYYSPPLRSKPIEDMSEYETIAYLQAMQDRVRSMLTQQQNYLAHRAKRGTRTPTDAMLEDQQRTLNEMLYILVEQEKAFRQAMNI